MRSRHWSSGNSAPHDDSNSAQRSHRPGTLRAPRVTMVNARGSTEALSLGRYTYVQAPCSSGDGPGEDFAARQHTVALVAALQTCIEDATKMYVETSGCFTAQGVRLAPAPSQQLESLLSARRGEVHVYLQRATGPGCPLLETFVW